MPSCYVSSPLLAVQLNLPLSDFYGLLYFLLPSKRKKSNLFRTFLNFSLFTPRAVKQYLHVLRPFLALHFIYIARWREICIGKVIIRYTTKLRVEFVLCCKVSFQKEITFTLRGSSLRDIRYRKWLCDIIDSALLNNEVAELIFVAMRTNVESLC